MPREVAGTTYIYVYIYIYIYIYIYTYIYVVPATSRGMCVVPQQSLLVTAIACCGYWNIGLPVVLMLVRMLGFVSTGPTSSSCSPSSWAY